jgi:hypothetical protein
MKEQPMAKQSGYWPRVLRFLARHEAKILLCETGHADDIGVQIRITRANRPPVGWNFIIDRETLIDDDVDRMAYEFFRGSLKLQREIEGEDNPGNTQP